MFISFQTMVSNGLQGKPGEPVGLPIFAGETPVFHPFFACMAWKFTAGLPKINKLPRRWW